MRKQEIAALLGAESTKRYEYTIKCIADSEQAWGLYNEGWAMYGDDEGRHLFPIWPAAEYAALCVMDDHASYVPEEIELDGLLNEVLPSLIEDGIALAVFPTPTGRSVTLYDPSDFERDLLEELSKYS